MIKVNIEKAKDIAHSVRRAKRSEEFKPIDGDLMHAVVNEVGETAREKVREKYKQIQVHIDAAQDEVSLKQVMKDDGLL